MHLTRKFLKENGTILSVSRLVLYFSRLIELGSSEEVLITLPEVANVMHTSSRHCRTLLKQMHELGWIKWQPKVGRNQRSQLQLLYSLEQLKTNLSEELILKGEYEKALTLIDNKQELFGQLLQKTSGTQWREERLHIQLTYDRTFAPLLPHTPQRNSERFLLRQIHSCLTQCDTDGNLTADLAHHWTYDDKKYVWRFYLRPHLKFHDGQNVNSSEIKQLFKQLKLLPLYKDELNHIDTITEINPLCIEFLLCETDPNFAALLSDIKYSIQPSAQVLNGQSTIGCGVFHVKAQNTQKITLQAYEKYHGFHALTDTVTIWQLPTTDKNLFDKTTLESEILKSPETVCSNHLTIDRIEKSVSNDKQSRVEDGCLLTLVNQRSDLSLVQRQYLSQIIGTDNLLKQLINTPQKLEVLPAYNILPSWLKILPTINTVQSLPERLTIAIFDHVVLKNCAKAISNLLQSVGVTCHIKVYSFEDFHYKASHKQLDETLIISSMNLDDNQPVSAFCWLLSNPVLQQSLPILELEWLKQKLYDTRRKIPTTRYLDELESIASALISSYWLIPILHHKQTLHFEDVLKSVSINVWGWPEIRDVWTDKN